MSDNKHYSVEFATDKIVKQTEEGGIAKYSYEDRDAYYAAAKEKGISKDDIKKVAIFNSDYITSASVAVGNFGEKALQANKKLDKVIVDMPFGRTAYDSVTVTVDRSKTYPGVGGSEPTTKSKISTNVKDGSHYYHKETIKELETAMTKKLLG